MTKPPGAVTDTGPAATGMLLRAGLRPLRPDTSDPRTTSTASGSHAGCRTNPCRGTCRS